MDVTDWIRQAKSRYSVAIDLIEVSSRSDPQNQPYKSKYEGRDILMSLVSDLQVDNFRTGNEDETTSKCLNLIQILILWHLSVVSLDVEEISVANKYSESAQQLLEEHFDQDLSKVLIHLKIYNTFSLIRCSLADHEKALACLKKAEDIYKKWAAVREIDADFRTVVAATDVFDMIANVQQDDGPDAVKDIEKEFTQTVYYLAQVLEKQGDSEMAAKYCTDTLVRQFHSGEYDLMDWSVNAATLSQYYACHNRFMTARRLLAAAASQLNKVELKDQDDQNELLNKRRADLDRIQVKYCMMLMDREDEGDVVETEYATGVQSLCHPEATDLEKDIPVVRSTTYETALPIFHFGHKHSLSAITYFTLNEHASDYADCILDQSMLYQRLIHFQSDPGKICKLHKRRVDLLLKLLSQLNPVHFLSHVRRISYELGETFSEMVHHKLADCENVKEENAVRTAVTKVNSLISKSIQYFGQFIDSFRDKSGHLPARFEEDDVRPVLMACFASGRLHSKRISSYPNEQLQFWTDCESWYQQIVDYIDKNPDQEDLIRQELNVIREMLPLIPEKKKLILTATMF